MTWESNLIFFYPSRFSSFTTQLIWMSINDVFTHDIFNNSTGVLFICIIQKDMYNIVFIKFYGSSSIMCLCVFHQIYHSVVAVILYLHEQGATRLHSSFKVFLVSFYFSSYLQYSHVPSFFLNSLLTVSLLNK